MDRPSYRPGGWPEDFPSDAAYPGLPADTEEPPDVIGGEVAASPALQFFAVRDLCHEVHRIRIQVADCGTRGTKISHHKRQGAIIGWG